MYGSHHLGGVSYHHSSPRGRSEFQPRHQRETADPYEAGRFPWRYHPPEYRITLIRHEPSPPSQPAAPVVYSDVSHVLVGEGEDHVYAEPAKPRAGHPPDRCSDEERLAESGIYYAANPTTVQSHHPREGSVAGPKPLKGILKTRSTTSAVTGPVRKYGDYPEFTEAQSGEVTGAQERVFAWRHGEAWCVRGSLGNLKFIPITFKYKFLNPCPLDYPPSRTNPANQHNQTLIRLIALCRGGTASTYPENTSNSENTNDSAGSGSSSG